MTHNYFCFRVISAVEAYMKVKEDVESNHSEQAFWTDAVGIINVYIQGMMKGWPNHELLIDALSQSQKVVLDYSLLRQLFPKWRNMHSIHMWLQHYAHYEFVAIDFDEDSGDDEHEDLKAHISDEMSVMLGVAPPTMFERIQERKRLNLIGYRVRQSRKIAAKEGTEDVLSPRGKKHKGQSKGKAKEKLSEEEVMRLRKKKNKMLQDAVPPSYVIKESAAQV
jgi:hypothetical protein